MGNEVRIKVKVDNESKAGLKDVSSSLHDVETASDKAGNALTRMGKQTTSAKDDLARLDKSIASSRDQLSKLASAFANTDDAAQRMDIRKAWTKVQGDLNAAMKARKIKLTEVIDVEPDRDTAQTFMRKFGNLIMSSGEGLANLAGSHVGLTIGAAAGAAAAPVLISTLGTMLSSNIGTGALGAGIALAVKNDKGIQEAGKLMGANLMKSLGDSAAVFNDDILKALGIVGDAGERVALRWGKVFDKLDDSVVPFVRDIVQAGETISNALAGAAENSGPAIDGLGDSIRLLADGVGNFISLVADGGPEAANNLRMIAGATGDVLTQTGALLNIMNKLSNNAWLTGPLLPILRKHYKDTADSSDDLKDSTAALAQESSAAARAAQGQTEAFDALNKELKAQADPVFGIIKAQKDLRDAEKDAAEAVKKHGRNSDEAKEAFQKQAIAALELEGNIGKLGDTFNGKLPDAMRATLRAAGLTNKAIDEIERQFKEAKRAGDRFEGKYQASLSLNGYRDAKGQLGGLLRDLQNFDGRWTATMITNYVRHGKPGTGGGLASGGIKGAADGRMSSDLTWVGEHGPELVDLPAGTRVHSNPDSQSMLSQAVREGGTGMGGVREVVARWERAGDPIMDALAANIRLYVKDNAGGDVQEAFGQRR